MSVNKVNIKEANDHLKQLHGRVIELENQVQMRALHAHELERVNADLHKKLQELEEQKNVELSAREAEISNLTQRLALSEGRVQALLEAAEERDRLVIQLETKARLFYETVEHREGLKRILDVLEELDKQRKLEDMVEEEEAGVRGKQSERSNGHERDSSDRHDRISSAEGERTSLPLQAKQLPSNSQSEAA